jgi:nucleolar MIF4G domain-containing protein 1
LLFIVYICFLSCSVLGELTRRFAESDVAMMLTLLNAVGLQLRAADPAAMKVGQYNQ